MITLRIVFDGVTDDDEDAGEVFTQVYDADTKEHSTITHPPGVPRANDVVFHLMLVPGGQVAVYQGRMVAWREVDHMVGLLDTVAWKSMLD